MQKLLYCMSRSPQAKCEEKYVGAIVCKIDNYTELSGYIAMLAVDKAYRKRGIGIFMK